MAWHVLQHRNCCFPIHCAAQTIDSVAFVLEQDGSVSKQPEGADSYGGLMEDDQTQAGEAEDEDVVVPINKPATKNAAGAVSSSSWLLLLSSCLLAAVLSGWCTAA